MRKPQGSRGHFLLHSKRGDLLRTYPRTYPFLFHHTIFFLLFILLQALHASLPPFEPMRFLPLIAWSLLLPAFSLAFYFTTYVSLFPYPLSSARQSHHFPPRNLPKKGLPLHEIAVALIASLLGGFRTVAMFRTLVSMYRA